MPRPAALAACGATTTATQRGAPQHERRAEAAAKGGTIALLLPETKTTRYELHDRPTFEAKVKALCPDCKIDYANANQDPAQQQQQAEAALTKGAKVLVLDAVDAKAAVAIVNRAKQAGVPVIAYDRLITGAPIDYYVSFDNVKVGKLQAQTLRRQDRRRGQGQVDGHDQRLAHRPERRATTRRARTRSWTTRRSRSARSTTRPTGRPTRPSARWSRRSRRSARTSIVGVYSANDGMASGAIAAMKGNGIDPKSLPTTGQDSEVAAIQRILAGEQYMTIYLAIKKQAEASAADGGRRWPRASPSPAGLVNAKVDNRPGQVPSVLLAPTAVTKDNIKDTIIEDDFLKASEICTTKYAKACQEAGVS